MRIALAILALSVFCIGAHAEEPFSTSITLRNHRFEPAEIHVPAGRRILHLKNEDPLSEEFDSGALKVEKVLPAIRKALFGSARWTRGDTNSWANITPTPPRAW